MCCGIRTVSKPTAVIHVSTERAKARRPLNRSRNIFRPEGITTGQNTRGLPTDRGADKTELRGRGTANGIQGDDGEIAQII